MWPVYLEIANVPPCIRFREDNMVICGVWVGNSKPEMSVLLSPILNDIERLNVVGFRSEGMNNTFRIKLLFGVFDFVAKAKVLSMIQFNGKYGCPTCLHPGEHKDNRHIYLPDSSYSLRTKESIDKARIEGENLGAIVEGIKGKSVLHGYLHLVNGIPPDYMHCILEGVTKSLLMYWTNSKYSTKPFSIRRHLKAVDDALLQQTPPTEISRSPRSLIKHLAYWKASEFRSWLLFYSLPLLHDVLPPLYFHHFSLLVCAIHILLQKHITLTECGAAEEMLLDFYSILPELYGETSCTINAHTLTHLAYYVRLLGPCWTHSAFSFESYNGTIKRAINSTRKVAEQLTYCLDVKLSLQQIYSDLESKESDECLQFLNIRRKSHSNMTKLLQGYAIGKIKPFSLTPSYFQALKKLCSSVNREVHIFDRLLLDDLNLHTCDYRDGVGKFCNAYCSYKQENGSEMYGEIHMFAECSPVGTVAFIKPYNNKHISFIWSTMSRDS